MKLSRFRVRRLDHPSLEYRMHAARETLEWAANRDINPVVSGNAGHPPPGKASERMVPQTASTRSTSTSEP